MGQEPQDKTGWPQSHLSNKAQGIFDITEKAVMRPCLKLHCKADTFRVYTLYYPHHTFVRYCRENPKITWQPLQILTIMRLEVSSSTSCQLK